MDCFAIVGPADTQSGATPFYRGSQPFGLGCMSEAGRLERQHHNQKA
jgi:hypothetical protein